MSSNLEKQVSDVLNSYLEKYGEDGYNEDTFVDFVVAVILTKTGRTSSIIIDPVCRKSRRCI